jgi:quercetin dioxygenase-like cupin family protein
MKNIVFLTSLFSLATLAVVAADEKPAGHSDMSAAPIFVNYNDVKWNKILPELGEASPEICVLHVDPKTKATKLMIRSPKAIHVRKHWHTGNESHTVVMGKATFACDGQKIEQNVGSFNLLPAKMVHEAWLSSGCVLFITTDTAWDVNWVEGPPTAADLMK